MPKKPAAKTKTKSIAPIKAAAQKKMKKKSAAPAMPTKTTGMWKILEMKQAQQQQQQQNGRDVRPHSSGNVLQPFARNMRFTKFAGPRRKVG